MSPSFLATFSSNDKRKIFPRCRFPLNLAPKMANNLLGMRDMVSQRRMQVNGWKMEYTHPGRRPYRAAARRNSNRARRRWTWEPAFAKVAYGGPIRTESCHRATNLFPILRRRTWPLTRPSQVWNRFGVMTRMDNVLIFLVTPRLLLLLAPNAKKFSGRMNAKGVTRRLPTNIVRANRNGIHGHQYRG